MMKKILLKLLSALCLVIFVPVVAAQELNEGTSIYNQICSHCHGGNGQGGQLGPSILQKVTQESDAELGAFLRQGNPERGMPPAPITDQQMPSLLTYLRSLSESVADSSFSISTTRNQYASMPAIENFEVITDQMLLEPDAEDWLWYSRTPDAQRFSPLDQINRENVNQLSMVWSKGLPEGLTETIPTVYNGIMYVTLPGSNVAALDATTGDTIWVYERDYGDSGAGGSGRSKTLSIYADMVYFAAPDSTIVALDAVTGEVRWEASVEERGNTSGTIVTEGKVISGGTCGQGPRSNCFISAHDAYTGEEVWRFYTTQAPDEAPGFDTWGGLPIAERLASTWGLPGGYDAEAGLIYWSVSNPMPNTRADRHSGNPDAIAYSAPSELFSNSTLALDPDTGEYVWYYQHLPGDDWDEDMNQERVILTTAMNPDPEHVRWINPNIEPGEVRDVTVNVGEGGGMWVLDKFTGEFLWATPFPENVDNFVLEDIDVATGTTYINRDIILETPGDHHIICFYNTRSYWPTAYNPEKNFLYVPYIRNCLNMTRSAPATETSPAIRESRIGIAQPGIDLDELNGLARVNMETGEITHWPLGQIPTNSAVLATAGDLIFLGDINRRYRAFDADNGEVLWETILSSPISVSNITYAVDGKQYIAVITGNNLSHGGLNTGSSGPIRLNIENGEGNNIFVFAIPE